MLDNLRNESSFQPEEEEPQALIQPEKPKKPTRPRRSFDQVTGTNAKQRLVLSVMLLVMVCLLGVILLVVAGKIVLPFM